MIFNDNCIDGMKQLATDSVDLIVTDPPYGMSFMGKNWDKALPPLESFKEMYRVLKPGHQAYIMCAPRSDLQSRMIILLEDAGFDVSNNPIFWSFATGFPKAQNISKQIDKRNGRKQETYIPFGVYLKEQRTKKGLSMKQIDEFLGTNTAYSWWEGRKSGIQLPRKEYYLQLKEILELDNRFDELIEREEAEREIIGTKSVGIKNGASNGSHEYGLTKSEVDITKDATPEAIKYNGAYAGYQPKPAVEIILVATKPRREINLDLHNKDCIEGMKELEDNTIDLIVTDPPYGMSFMGKQWDKALPPIEAFKEMCRVLKPGAFAFVMCAPRSDLQARMSILLEDAGFDIAFTPIYWTFATGFPKAQNISKQIDKRNGRTSKDLYEFAAYLKEKREAKGLTKADIDRACDIKSSCYIWEGDKTGQIQAPTMESYKIIKPLLEMDNRFDKLIEREEAQREIIGKDKRTANDSMFNIGLGEWNITKDATPEAQKYNGAYAGFQPKPAVEVVIVAMKPKTEKTYVDQVLNNGKGITWLDDCRINERFPANLLVSDDSLNDGIERKFDMHMPKRRNKGYFNQDLDSTKELKEIRIKETGSYSRYFDLDAWFAIIPKPSKKEKGEGNTHPTVKPIKLMSYLITLGSRPDEIVLDPFMGSGTTGISAKLTERNFIGYEMEEEYFQIAEARINAWETTTVGQNKEDGRKDKEDGKSQPDGTRTGQTTLASN